MSKKNLILYLAGIKKKQAFRVYLTALTIELLELLDIGAKSSTTLRPSRFQAQISRPYLLFFHVSQAGHFPVRIPPSRVRMQSPRSQESLAGSCGLLQCLPLQGKGVHEAVSGESANGDGEKGFKGPPCL